MEVAAPDELVARLRAAGCVFAEEEAELLLAESTGAEELERLVARRVAGEPLEQLVGWVDFAGVRVALAPGIFLPRQRTAYLVELAAAVTPPRAVVVDLCCGSGALGLALAQRRPAIELHASDVDPAAVACARRNLEPVGASVHEGDLDAALPRRLRGRVDVLVANVPYVPSAAVALMPADSRDHEPRIAVDGGPDGLDVVRRVARLVPRWLTPGGRFFLEAGRDQADRAAEIISSCGLASRVHHDHGRGATVVAGRLSPGCGDSARSAGP